MIDTCDKFDNVFLEIFEQLCTFKKGTTQGKSCFACFKRYAENYNEKVFPEPTKNKKIYWSRLYKKVRNKFFNNLNPSFVTDNKLFGKKIKPFIYTKIIMVLILSLLKMKIF